MARGYVSARPMSGSTTLYQHGTGTPLRKKTEEQPGVDPYFLQRILLAVIEANPDPTMSAKTRLTTAMDALLGLGKRQVAVPWPLSDAEYYEAVKQLRLTEMWERLVQDTPPEQQVGIMSLRPEKKSRNKRIAEAVDQFQAHSDLQDPEGTLKRHLEVQPTRSHSDYQDLHEVLRLLQKHGVKTGKQK